MVKFIRLSVLLFAVLAFTTNLQAQYTSMSFNVTIDGKTESYTVPANKVHSGKASYGAVFVSGKINADQYVVDKTITVNIEKQEVGKYEIGNGKKSNISYQWEKGSKSFSSKKDNNDKGFVEVTKIDKYGKLSGKFKYSYQPEDFKIKRGAKPVLIEGTFENILIK